MQHIRNLAPITKVINHIYQTSLSITEIAGLTRRPDKVIGTHFFNPVPSIKFVAVIRGSATSDRVLQIVKKISINMGMTPIEINDAPGLVASPRFRSLYGQYHPTIATGINHIRAMQRCYASMTREKIQTIAFLIFIVFGGILGERDEY